MDTQEMLDKWQVEFKKGFSKPLLLLVLSEQSSYPYKLTKQVRELTSGVIEIAPSNTYPMLKSLLDDGLVSKYEDQTGGTKKRTMYQITPIGSAFLDDLRDILVNFLSVLKPVLEENHNE